MAQEAAGVGGRGTILKYAGISLIGFSIDAALLHAGVQRGLAPAWARVISLFCAMQATFVINGQHVFKALQWPRLPQQWASYMATNAVGNFCNYWIFVTMVSTHWRFVSDRLLALTVSSFIAWMLNFASARFLVFPKAASTIRRVP